MDDETTKNPNDDDDKAMIPDMIDGLSWGFIGDQDPFWLGICWIAMGNLISLLWRPVNLKEFLKINLGIIVELHFKVSCGVNVQKLLGWVLFVTLW